MLVAMEVNIVHGAGVGAVVSCVNIDYSGGGGGVSDGT